MNFKKDDVIKMNHKYLRNYNLTIENQNFKVEWTEGDGIMQVISVNDSSIVLTGWFEDGMFEYVGNNVNNEVYHLAENSSIKSFQAILEDGRIINFSCLN